MNHFVRVVRGTFTQRRKTLANALKAVVGDSGIAIPAALDAAGIDGRRRPETLDLAEYAALAKALDAGPRRP